jgi:hypothetical protein
MASRVPTTLLNLNHGNDIAATTTLGINNDDDKKVQSMSVFISSISSSFFKNLKSCFKNTSSCASEDISQVYEERGKRVKVDKRTSDILRVGGGGGKR